MRVDLGSKTYSFAFSPTCVGSFSPKESENRDKPFLQHLCAEVVNITTLMPGHPKGLERDVLLAEFPSLFSSSLGTAKCTPYDIELSDATPVRSAPYRRAPPRLQIFKQTVNELLE